LLSSNPSVLPSPAATPRRLHHFSKKFVTLVALSWGLCAFFPIGVMYLNLLLLLIGFALAPDLMTRLRGLRQHAASPPIVLMLVWVLIAVVVGDWYPDTATRLFHTFRVALVLFVGLMLTSLEARAALAGFLVSAVFAAFIVTVHHVFGMPDWAIWNGLLSSRNNFSSGNMITLATASCIYFYLGIRKSALRGDKWLFLAAALALGATVALHAVSRNSQLLLVVLVLAAVIYRFRSLRATLGGLAAVLVLATAMWQFSPTTQNRFVDMASNLEAAELESNYATSVGVRWRMYQEAVQGMADHPLFGTGLGSWLPHWRSVWLALEEHLPPVARHRFSEINNPHNDFLLTGMETGVIGLIILVWLLASFIRTGWRQRSAAGGITVVMGVSIFTTALVNAPFRDAALGMTLLWLLAVSVAAHAEARNE